MKTMIIAPRSRMSPGLCSVAMLLGIAGMLVTASQSAFAQPTSTYEPSSRQRLRAEACMKDEVEQGALCVKRCDPDFKLEANGKKPLCRATKSGATHQTAPSEYQPPKSVPNAPPPRGY